MQIKGSWSFATLLLATVAAAPARAEDFIPGGEEQFKFTIGGVLASINSSIGIDGATNNGTLIDLNGPTGNKNATSVVLGATWRPASNHRISGMFFQTKKTRSLAFGQTVTIGDDSLVPPTTLATTAKNRFLFATYEYSFVKKNDIEIAGLLGAYLNKFSADLTGTATVKNSIGTTTVNKTVDYRPSVTVPMPLIGASLNWHASPQITLGTSLSGLKAKIGDVDGSVYVVTASAEYMFTRNFGAGLAYMHANANVDINKRSFVGTIDWKNDNVLLYATAKF